MTRELALRCANPDLELLLELAELEAAGLLECEVGDDRSVRCRPTAAAIEALAEEEAGS